MAPKKESKRICGIIIAIVLCVFFMVMQNVAPIATIVWTVLALLTGLIAGYLIWKPDFKEITIDGMNLPNGWKRDDFVDYFNNMNITIKNLEQPK